MQSNFSDDDGDNSDDRSAEGQRDRLGKEMAHEK